MDDANNRSRAQIAMDPIKKQINEQTREIMCSECMWLEVGMVMVSSGVTEV